MFLLYEQAIFSVYSLVLERISYSNATSVLSVKLRLSSSQGFSHLLVVLASQLQKNRLVDQTSHASRLNGCKTPCRRCPTSTSFARANSSKTLVFRAICKAHSSCSEAILGQFWGCQLDLSSCNCSQVQGHRRVVALSDVIGQAIQRVEEAAVVKPDFLPMRQNRHIFTPLGLLLLASRSLCMVSRARPRMPRGART